MFDIGWSEMTVIMILAVIVIGPRDLPRVMRAGGRFLRRVRSLAREFQEGLDQIADDVELDEIKKSVEDVAKGYVGGDDFDPIAEAAKAGPPDPLVVVESETEAERSDGTEVPEESEKPEQPEKAER